MYTESEAYLATAMDLRYYAAKGIVSCAIGGTLGGIAAVVASVAVNIFLSDWLNRLIDKIAT